MAQVESPLPVNSWNGGNTLWVSEFGTRTGPDWTDQVVGADESAAGHVRGVGGHRAFLLQNVLLKAQWNHGTFVVQTPAGDHLSAGGIGTGHHLCKTREGVEPGPEVPEPEPTQVVGMVSACSLLVVNPSHTITLPSWDELTMCRLSWAQSMHNTFSRGWGLFMIIRHSIAIKMIPDVPSLLILFI